MEGFKGFEMNASINRFVWCGVVAAGLLGAVTSNANGQGCGCVNANQGLVYETGMPAELSPESLLQVTDDPSQIINLIVVVQDKTIVTINGEETYTKGTVRPYIVRGLTPGKDYTFEIAGLLKNEAGAHFTAKKTVKLKAGGQEQVVLKLSRTNRPAPLPVPPAGGVVAVAGPGGAAAAAK